jgi:hypothetical protein
MATIGKKISLDEMIARARKDNHTHDFVQANYAQVVAEVETELGPQVPPITLRRGRPRKGETADTVQVKSVKMTPDFWISFQALAEADGMNMHAAMRAALVEWMARHQAS